MGLDPGRFTESFPRIASALSGDDLSALLAVVTRHEQTVGDRMVVRPGELVFLLSGQLRRSLGALELDYVGAGTLIGGESFLERLNSPTERLVLSPTAGLVLRREQIQELCLHRPELARAILHGLADRLALDLRGCVEILWENGRVGSLAPPRSSGRDFTPEVAFLRFANLEGEERVRMREVLDTRRIAAGQSLMGEGDLPVELYQVLRGLVSVSLREGRRRMELALLGPGEVIGLLALVQPIRRSADVVALSDVELSVLPRSVFERLYLEGRPEGLSWGVARQLARDLARLSTMLHEDSMDL